MAKRLFEKLDHSINYDLFRPNPPSSLIKQIVQYLGLQGKTKVRSSIFIYAV